MQSKKILSIILIGLLSVVLLLILPFIPYLPSSNGWEDILLKLRVPRSILSYFAGGSLALIGLIFQLLLRNDLATPFTLGISSGVSLGASVMILFQPFFIQNIFKMITDSAISEILVNYTTIIGGWIGGLLTVFLLLTFSRLFQLQRTGNIIFIGIILNFWFSSVITLMNYLGNPYLGTNMIQQWLFGNTSIIGFQKIGLIFPLLLIGLTGLVLLMKPLILLAIDDEFAISKGINVKRLQWLIILFSSIVITSIVSITGPLAFIGLIVPFFSRRIWPLTFPQLFLGTFLMGSLFLTSVDSISRFLNDLPIGFLLTFIGAPSFLIMFISMSRKQS